MKIYLCMASQGEYSDRNERVICAYSNKNKAEEHILAAEKFLADAALKLISLDKEHWELEWEEQSELNKSPFDPGLAETNTDPSDVDGGYYPRYFLIETELLETEK